MITSLLVFFTARLSLQVPTSRYFAYLQIYSKIYSKTVLTCPYFSVFWTLLVLYSPTYLFYISESLSHLSSCIQSILKVSKIKAYLFFILIIGSLTQSYSPPDDKLIFPTLGLCSVYPYILLPALTSTLRSQASQIQCSTYLRLHTKTCKLNAQKNAFFYIVFYYSGEWMGST